MERPDGPGRRLFFQLVPEDKTGKDSIHFDVQSLAIASAPPPTTGSRVQIEAADTFFAGTAVAA